jgi:hypothetical protein
MSDEKTLYDPAPPKITYLFGRDFFEDERANKKRHEEAALDAYLRYLSDGNTKVYAMRRAGISGSTISTRRANNSEFRALEERALEEGSDCIEQEMIRRGRDGTLKEVYYKGEVVGHERVFSDSLLLAVMKSKKPEYRESRNVVSAEINSQVTQQPAIDTTKYTEEELLQLEELLSRGQQE